jgi:GDP-mannose 6-dehydrogenase
MRLSVFGMGYVGAVSAACLARDGHEVIGVDIDPHKLDLIRKGESPIIEEGIRELMQTVVRAGRLRVTDDVHQAIGESEVSFVCVGTPALPNGSQDLGALQRLSEQLGKALGAKNAHHVVVVRSTVRPGTMDSVVRPLLETASGKRCGEGFSLAFQPEFLREGSSIRDYDNPPFTVVGSDSPRAIDSLRTLFGRLPCEFLATRTSSAEMLKYACNSFHAVKVTFANEVGRLSQALGCDPFEVMELLCKDRQLNISRAYLRPGFAFGGSCLPKDLKSLLYQARTSDVELPLLSGVLSSNRAHVDHALQWVLARGRPRVGMLGLSFKPGTDDLRESPLVTLAEQLIGKGIELRIYDPTVKLAHLIGANRRYIESTIPHIASLMVDSTDELMKHAAVVVVGMVDAEVRSALQQLRDGQSVLDLVGLGERASLRGEYRGLCW